MSQSTHSGRNLHRWRGALIVLIVVPAILCACAIRLARASSYTTQPILCDGVDDDAGASFLFGLPEDMTKKILFDGAKSTPLRQSLLRSNLPSFRFLGCSPGAEFVSRFSRSPEADTRAALGRP
jgi:hypothetical protein